MVWRCLLSLNLLWVAALGLAQTVTNTAALQELARKMDAQKSQNRRMLLMWSRSNHVPLKQTTPWGKTRELVRWAGGWRLVYETCNLDAAKTINVDDVWPGGASGLNLNGSGLTLGIWDGNSVLSTHQEFGGRVTNVENVSSNFHATHCGGTMAAAGLIADAKGMAFAASLRSFEWNDDTSEMATEAAGGLRVSNHSYAGYYDNYANWNYGFYDPVSQEWDQLAFDAPFYLIVKAASNDQSKNTKGGFDTIPTNGVAKNILTVGAVNSLPGGYVNPASVSMTNFSSWGPTDDGRIKPDVVADGVNLYSTSNSSNTAYGYSSGTSMSAPTVAGGVGLLIQHYRNMMAGSDPRSATLKALLIATANEAGPSDGPDYKFGWGLVDVAKAAKVITDNTTTPGLIVQDSISTGQTREFTFTTDGTPFRVAIAWTDRPGTPPGYGTNDPTDAMLVNDLDLRVVNNSNTTQPWILNPASPNSAATRGDNFRDNVERVDVSSPAAGLVTVRVTAKGTLVGGSQAFSLVALGLRPGSAPTVSALSFVPATVTGGQNSTGTVTISSPAPAGGTSVSLVSGNPTRAQVPASVTVAQGQTTANFTVQTTDVPSETVVTVTASLDSSQVQGAITIKPIPKLAGTGVLCDFSGDKTGVPITLQVRTPGTTTVLETLTVYLDSNGAFSVPTTMAPGSYDLAFKASHWLRKVITNVSVTSTGLGGISFSLMNGDVSGDNNVNLTDLNAISRAWRSVPTSPNWDPMADLNGDGTVNLSDRNIVSRNWRQKGDN